MPSKWPKVNFSNSFCSDVIPFLKQKNSHPTKATSTNTINYSCGQQQLGIYLLEHSKPSGDWWMVDIPSPPFPQLPWKNDLGARAPDSCRGCFVDPAAQCLFPVCSLVAGGWSPGQREEMGWLRLLLPLKRPTLPVGPAAASCCTRLGFVISEQLRFREHENELHGLGSLLPRT